jgi:hypothetical protein
MKNPSGTSASSASSRKMLAQLMNLYQEKPSIQMFIEGFLTVGAITIFVAFAIRPTLTTIGKLLSEIREKEAVAMKLDDKISAISLAQDNYRNAGDLINFLSDYIPETPQIDRATIVWETLSKNSQVSMVALNGGPVTITNSDGLSIPTTFPLKLSFEGTYEALSNFINASEDSGRPIVPREMSIRVVDEIPDTLNLQITGDVVYFPRGEKFAP